MEPKIGEPYVRIVEQPARSAVRFRYECEGRSAGPIPGVNSSSSCATYPTIQVMNYAGRRAMVVVSCVTVTEPYRQHPHHLVGRVGCHNGICTMIIDNCDHLCTFTHLGIQCAKRNEIAQRLKMRKQLQIDPTFGGFDHISKSSRSLDLGAIRLCFQVYIEDPITRKFTSALTPVVSDPVYDKKLLPKLIITDISSTCCPITGGKVMLFCNYIDEEDIEVRFYRQDSSGQVIWESVADLKPPLGEVHKRVGISMLAPPFPLRDSTHPVHAFLQLRRPSDQKTSEPIVFTYLPLCRQSDNCPMLEFTRLSTHDHLAHVTSNSGKRGRNKANKESREKRVKVLDVLNGSDSEDMEETEEADEETEEDGTQYGGPHQQQQQFPVKADMNNNPRAIPQLVTNNNSQQPNDLLVECLKTIDIESLAAIQFTDNYNNNNNNNNYTEDEWTAVGYYGHNGYGNYGHELHENVHQYNVQNSGCQSVESVRSFIDL